MVVNIKNLIFFLSIKIVNFSDFFASQECKESDLLAVKYEESDILAVNNVKGLTFYWSQI